MPPLITSAPRWHMFPPQLSALWVPKARAAKSKTNQNTRLCFTPCPPKKIKASGPVVFLLRQRNSQLALGQRPKVLLQLATHAGAGIWDGPYARWSNRNRECAVGRMERTAGRARTAQREGQSPGLPWSPWGLQLPIHFQLQCTCAPAADLLQDLACVLFSCLSFAYSHSGAQSRWGQAIHECTQLDWQILALHLKTFHSSSPTNGKDKRRKGHFLEGQL